MNLLFSINHPAHVHFFRNAALELGRRGHTVHITNRRKDITDALLARYGLASTPLSTQRSGLIGMAGELAGHARRLHGLLREWNIDMALSIGGTFIVHACALRRIPSLVFCDTEHASLQNRITYPFATKIITPECYRHALGSKQIRYRGYHELAYLHPNHYTPPASAPAELGVGAGEPYVIMRFVGWQAMHDIGHCGLSLEHKIEAVEKFSDHAQVFITSEKELHGKLAEFRVRIPPEQMHDALYHASLLYGESATMASECAVLGTPAIFIDNDGRGYTDEQEHRYGAVFNFSESPDDQARSIQKGLELLTAPDLTDVWRRTREQILNDTIDVTAWIVDLVEDWPPRNSPGA